MRITNTRPQEEVVDVLLGGSACATTLVTLGKLVKCWHAAADSDLAVNEALVEQKDWSGDAKPKREEAHGLGAVIQHGQPHEESRVPGFVGY
jgi:hypothetical protein